MNKYNTRDKEVFIASEDDFEYVVALIETLEESVLILNKDKGDEMVEVESYSNFKQDNTLEKPVLIKDIMAILKEAYKHDFSLVELIETLESTEKSLVTYAGWVHDD